MTQCTESGANCGECFVRCTTLVMKCTRTHTESWRGLAAGPSYWVHLAGESSSSVFCTPGRCSQLSRRRLFGWGCDASRQPSNGLCAERRVGRSTNLPDAARRPRGARPHGDRRGLHRWSSHPLLRRPRCGCLRGACGTAHTRSPDLRFTATSVHARSRDLRDGPHQPKLRRHRLSNGESRRHGMQWRSLRVAGLFGDESSCVRRRLLRRQ